MASLVSRLWTKLYKKRPTLSIMIVGLDNSGKTSILNNLMSLDQPPSSSSSSHEPVTRQLNSHDKSRAAAASHMRQPMDRDRRAAIRRTGQSDNMPNPTVGYNYERIQYKGLTLTALDFSGQNRYRNLWQEFYNCVDAIVFVIDSSDLIRLVVVRDELETMLSHPYFSTLSADNQVSDNDLTNRQPITPPTSIGAQKRITLNQGKLIQSPLDGISFETSSSSSILSPSNRDNKTPARRQRIRIPILFLANKSDMANAVDIEVIVRALNLNQLPKSRHPWLILATSINQNQGIGEGFDWLVSQLSAAKTTATSTPS